jgi:glycosyltransferase involved in cell wall biosynthesis
MPRLSIIIATYNSGKTLRNALESVHVQTFQDWECIIVDGASKDNTLQIVEEYEKLDVRFRHISEPDKGVYDAFNKGWRLAKGEWIHYLGDDDHLTDDGLATLLCAPDLDKFEVVSGHCYMEKIDGTIKANYSHGFFGCHQGKLTRRSTLERFDGFKMCYPILADKDLMLRMERAGVKILNVDAFVAFFAMNGMSQKLKGLLGRAKEFYEVHKDNHISHPLLISIRYAVATFFAICYRRLRRSLKL